MVQWRDVVAQTGFDTVACRQMLRGRPQEIEARVAAAWNLMYEELPGADIKGMVTHDPGLLFLDVKIGELNGHLIQNIKMHAVFIRLLKQHSLM